MIRRALNTALRRASTLLIGFGIVLVLVGAGVQAMRTLRVRNVEQRAPAPSFESSLRAAEPRSGVSLEPISLPEPMGTATIERVDRRFLPLAILRRQRYRFGTPTSAAASGAAATSEAVPAVGAGAVARTIPPDAAPPERIIIPSLNLDRRVVEIGWDVEVVDNDTLRSVWQTARHAAGFHRGSAPVGAPGNTVISGHNNIDGAVFGELHRLEPGDRVMIEAAGQLHSYAVEMNFIVQEEGVSMEQRLENARWIGGTPDERLTLVTCYPPWGNTHRTIVVARPVEDGSGGLSREGAR